ncbi:integral membrane protein [Colletotrichum higginsianum]|nr:integral membrane protein [Colletotrichum higginsianum]
MLRSLRFLDDKAVQQDDLHDMLRHLDYQEKPSVVSPYLDEDPDSAERKEILTWLKTTEFPLFAGEARKLIHPSNFTPLVWSAFAIAPIEQLRDLRLKEDQIHLLVGVFKDRLPGLMNIFLARNPSPKDKDKDEHGSASTSTNAKKRKRAGGETGKNTRDMKARNQVGGFIKCLDTEGYDHPRNMVSLNCAFHNFWGKAMVALEPIEVAKDGTWIIVQVRWMHNSKLGSRFDKKYATVEQVDIDMPVKDILQPLTNEHNVPIRIIDLETQRYIKDGHRFKITSEDRELLPSEDLLRLQYNLCRMASLTGAAEPDDDANSDSDSEVATEIDIEEPLDWEAWNRKVETYTEAREAEMAREAERAREAREAREAERAREAREAERARDVEEARVPTEGDRDKEQETRPETNDEM